MQKAPAACCNTLWPGPPECDYPSLMQITFRDRRSGINRRRYAGDYQQISPAAEPAAPAKWIARQARRGPACSPSDSYAASSSWGMPVFAATSRG